MESALEYAMKIISAYEVEIRGRPDLMEKGFCQGVVFATAEAHIKHLNNDPQSEDLRDAITALRIHFFDQKNPIGSRRDALDAIYAIEKYMLGLDWNARMNRRGGSEKVHVPEVKPV